MEKQFGFSTLEIMMAMAVAVCALTAAASLVFGGQQFVIDAQKNSQARAAALEMLARQRILAQDDFRLVNAATSTNGIYSREVKASWQSFFAKKILARVSWSESGRSSAVALETIIADYGGTAGNDTCDSNLSGDWTNPRIEKVINLNDFAESASSSYAVGDIDVYMGKLYVAITKTGTSHDSTLFIFDVDNPSLPLLLDKIDNNNLAMAGINAIAANKNYVYAASVTAKNFQIIDVSQVPLKIFSHKINNGEEAVSVFYRNNYVYLGLAKVNGPEFNIIDASDANDPVIIGSFEIGAGVSDIYVKGDYAYLAHPADLTSLEESGREQLTILNIADPANPYRAGGFFHEAGMLGFGKSLRVIGNRIYFGRTTSHIGAIPDDIPDFFIFDAAEPAVISVLGSRAFSRVGSLNGLIIRDNLAFVLLGTTNLGGDLRILSIANPDDIVEEKIIGLPGDFGGGGGAALDCEGNNLYMASIDGAGKSYISIISAE